MKTFMQRYSEAKAYCRNVAEGDCTPVVFDVSEMGYGLGVWRSVSYRSTTIEGQGCTITVYDPKTREKLGLKLK